MIITRNFHSAIKQIFRLQIRDLNTVNMMLVLLPAMHITAIYDAIYRV